MEEVLKSHDHLSIYQVARELKKENQGLWNCVQSILSDATFVNQVREHVTCTHTHTCTRTYTHIHTHAHTHTHTHTHTDTLRHLHAYTHAHTHTHTHIHTHIHTLHTQACANSHSYTKACM